MLLIIPYHGQSETLEKSVAITLLFAKYHLQHLLIVSIQSLHALIIQVRSHNSCIVTSMHASKSIVFPVILCLDRGVAARGICSYESIPTTSESWSFVNCFSSSYMYTSFESIQALKGLWGQAIQLVFKIINVSAIIFC